MNDHVDAPMVINPPPHIEGIASVAARKASMRLVIDDLGISCEEKVSQSEARGFEGMPHL